MPTFKSGDNMPTEAPPRVTKRKFAHELYPHADEFEVRPLALEVAYLYAIMVGLSVWDSDWYDVGHGRDAKNPVDRPHIRLTNERIKAFIAAKEKALLADAMLQGMTGNTAWEWAMHRAVEDDSSSAYLRADFYNVPIEDIKPYWVLAEPDHHTHYGPADRRGWRTSTRVEGRESECHDCTVEVPRPDPNQLALPLDEEA